MAVSAVITSSGQKTIKQWVCFCAPESMCGFMCQNMTVGVCTSSRECITLHILAGVREKQCSVVVTLIFSLSNYQGPFAGNPPHHHLVVFHSSPMDRTQHDLQLLRWPDTMSLRRLMNNQEPTMLYKIRDKAEWLD